MALPEKKFRAGAVAATIWKNQAQNKMGEPVEFRTVQIDRRYTDKEGQWKSTNTFRITDLPKVRVVADEAYRYLVLAKDEPTPNEAPPKEQEQPEEEIVM